MGIAWSILSPLLPGVLICRCFGLRARTDPVAWAGWIWTTGAFATASTLFLALHLDLPPEWWWTAPLWPALVSGVLGAWRGWLRTPSPAPAPRPSRLFVAAVALITAATALTVVGAGSAPTALGDEASFWARKARLIYDSGGFTHAFETNIQDATILRHRDYPLMNPLLQAWAYACAGGLTSFDNRWPILAFGLALATILAAGSARRAHPLVAVGLLILVMSLPCTARLLRGAWGDLMVGTGLLMAADAWLRSRDAPHPAWTFLASLGLAIAAWSKNEGVIYLIAVGTSYLILRPIRPGIPFLRSMLAVGFLPCVVVLVSQLFNRHYGVLIDYLDPARSAHGLMERVGIGLSVHFGTVNRYLLTEIILNVRATHLVFLVVLVAVGVSGKGLWRSTLAAPALTLLLIMASWWVMYLGTHQPMEWHLATSAKRVTWQSLPLAALWLAGWAGYTGLAPPSTANRPADAAGAFVEAQ